jgi:hypothetical protein
MKLFLVVLSRTDNLSLRGDVVARATSFRRRVLRRGLQRTSDWDRIRSDPNRVQGIPCGRIGGLDCMRFQTLRKSGLVRQGQTGLHD